MDLVIIPSDKTIGIGTTIITGISTDMSWIPSDVHAVHWDGSKGEIEYNDGKPNITINSLGIYSQAEETLNNELLRMKDQSDKAISDTTFLWEKLRVERDDLLFDSDWTQSRDVNLANDNDWKTYRQALRDLPANTSDPANPTWPTKPS